MGKENKEALPEKVYATNWKNVMCCPVCCYPYGETKTKTPRLLQCGHTACHECLQHIVKEAAIACPICRAVTPALRNKVESLKKNFAVLDAFAGHEVVCFDVDAQDGTFDLFHPNDFENESVDHQNESRREQFHFSCKPKTDHQSRTVHSIGLMVLMGNLFFDWLVNDHVDKIATMLERGKLQDGESTNIPSLQTLYDIGIDWNVIGAIFLVFAILSTICYALQFFGTMLTWLFKDKNKSSFQSFLLFASLLLNDLPQCILITIVTYATDDVYIPYFCSTLLGVLGNYIIFIALSNTHSFYYPKVVCCHAVLVGICLTIQIAHVTKAHIT